ncbi:hypothetical protein G6F46_007308 [Rhizopus delemar]|uniref:Uncharacterized protein n=2 Tax=Rhizopus TaxID=4842 RepID=A0A9P6YT01_9FUNG|nr:hypothetical protein G6F36_012669 [Rhizopus arrhizus]KAG1457390.1 hypothetical protein G6F55_005963 [Rhizopus delemar]KAG1496062.1 hypothetical protein G6F54_006738 [Rhizopus delemar]KAG1509993.1 hypothetical protein G6F53_007018 [Rhizopus delemar]KAG1545328.1 hypothetical protein G6F49_010826 [Rhizopus delemar]
MLGYFNEVVEAVNIDDFEERIEQKKIKKGKEEVCRFAKDIFKVMAKVYIKRPSLSHSKVVFNTNMIFPAFQAMMTLMKKNGYEPYFIPGEEELVAMTVQLKRMGIMVNKRQIYRADGVVRLAAIKDLEVVVLETAGPFGSDDRSKSAFDNSKGMFALLVMLKTIADIFKQISTPVVDELLEERLI